MAMIMTVLVVVANIVVRSSCPLANDGVGIVVASGCPMANYYYPMVPIQTHLPFGVQTPQNHYHNDFVESGLQMGDVFGSEPLDIANPLRKNQNHSMDWEEDSARRAKNNLNLKMLPVKLMPPRKKSGRTGRWP